MKLPDPSGINSTPSDVTDIISSARCLRCKEIKPATEFHISNGKPYSYCKSCQRAYQRERRAANPEKVRARLRAARARNPERYRQYDRNSRQRNIDKVRARDRQRGKEEKRLEANRRRYYERDGYRAYRLRNKEKRYAQSKQWVKNNRDRYNSLTAAAQHRRRARKFSAPIVEKIDRAIVFERDNYICYLCLCRFPVDKLSLDHVIPLSRGGAEAYSNIKTACLPCNLKKGVRLLTELNLADFLP